MLMRDSVRPVPARAAAALSMALLGVGSVCAQILQRGAVFPNFTEPDLRTGKPVKLEDFRGKVVLVDFWASWCPACRHEIPNVKKVYKKYHKDGLEIISISLDGSVDTCKGFIKEYQMDWYHIGDGQRWKSKLAKKHGINSIPRAVVVGRDGKIISADAEGAELDSLIAQALKQEGKPGEKDSPEAKAKARLAEADKLRDAGNVGEALKLYDEIASQYGTEPSGRLAQDRARELRHDPGAVNKGENSPSDAAEKEAASKSETWLKTARQFAQEGKPDLARKYYQHVIDKYPGTKVAKTAEEEMKKLPR